MRKAMVAALAMIFAACSSGGTGTVVGFLINGQTGERMNLFDKSGNIDNLSGGADSTKQVYTIINGEFVRATACGQGFVNEKNGVQAAGCFQIANVPAGEQLPIFAVYDGFEKFHGVYEYPVPAGDFTTPQVVANIRIFPKNYTVDYKLLVNMDGRGINDVTVACQIRQESVSLSTDGKFIPPLNTTSPAISGVTANDGTYGDGFMKIAGTDLVLGAKYHCEAFRAASGLYENRGVLSGSVEFRAGVDGPEVSLALSATKTADDDLIYAVFSNADDQNTLMGNKGALIITFNRAVEIVPGTADCQTAHISAPDTNGDGNLPPYEQNDQVGNGGSEQVTVTKTGDTGLKIAFQTPNNGFDSKDVGAMVIFGGIYVRPAASQMDGTDIRIIGNQSNGCSASAVLGGAPELKNARTGGAQTSTLHLY